MTQGPDVRRIEQLMAEMALTFNWISLYQAGHPSLAGRVEKLHRSLAEVLDEEASGHLLLGVAKDKILYQSVFLANGNSLVRNFTSELFLQQVATLDFSGEATPQELLEFFLALHRLRVEKKEEEGKLDEILKGKGVKGIGVYPYNYKEVLSRRILLPGEQAPSSNREDELWRMLLTENVSAVEGDEEVLPNLRIPPEMIPAILKRVQAAAEEESARDAGPEPADAMSPDLVRQILAHLGESLRRLPVEQRVAVIQSLDKRAGDSEDGKEEALAEPDIIRSLTETDSNDDFLDMLAGLVTVEEKSGSRLRKVFEVIAGERNRDGSLLSAVQERTRESVRTKNYYAQMTWETLERLLLQRTEGDYITQDHSHLLDRLSTLDAATGGVPEGRPAVDAAVLAEFDEGNLHLKGAVVLLELLAEEEAEGEFLELLEEIRKILPNLISRKELPLMKTTLSTLTSVHRNAPESRKASIARVIGEVDFAHMVDLYLSPAVSKEEKGRIEELLVSFVGVSIGDFLDRMLMEPDQGNRKILLSLAFRFDAEAIPAILEKLDEPHWYFVRNLCVILGKIGDPSAVPDLVRLLDHKEPRVRKEAILALGQLGAPEAVPYLGKILLHDAFLQSAREEAMRIDAANAIFRCGGTRGIALLHRGTESKRTKVREHCAGLLVTLRGKK